jgi:hypothetical protein
MDMLGDGSCVYEERGCTDDTLALNIALGIAVSFLYAIGCFGL